MTNGLHTHAGAQTERKHFLSIHPPSHLELVFPVNSREHSFHDCGRCIKLDACVNRVALKSVCVCNVCVLKSRGVTRYQKKKQKRAADGSTCGRATAESFQERVHPRHIWCLGVFIVSPAKPSFKSSVYIKMTLDLKKASPNNVYSLFHPAEAV